MGLYDLLFLLISELRDGLRWWRLGRNFEERNCFPGLNSPSVRFIVHYWPLCELHYRETQNIMDCYSCE